MAEHRVDVIRLPLSVTAFVGATYSLIEHYPEHTLFARPMANGDCEIFYNDDDDPEDPVAPPQ